MPEALQSLAVWPVISGLIFMFRSLGIAYNEVVIALLDEPNASRTLMRFTLIMAAILSTGLLLIASTPLAHLWFQQVSGLSPELANLARVGVWFAVVLPALAALQSWYQGAILHSRRTRAITEAVIIYLVSSAVLLGIGVVVQKWFGLYVGLAAMSISMALQTAWLWWRSRDVISAHITQSASQLHPAEVAIR
jgi:Na+-driven multidrug efflux pump